MKKESEDKLRNYIEKWEEIPNKKPCNEDEFIKLFIELCNTLEDERDITFEGEGAYFGKQVRLRLNSMWGGDNLIHFEIAYDKNQISCYKGNNEGFWQPEYMVITSQYSKFDEIAEPFFKLLHKTFGLEWHK